MTKLFKNKTLKETSFVIFLSSRRQQQHLEVNGKEHAARGATFAR
jgi:hypothetical protein